MELMGKEMSESSITQCKRLEEWFTKKALFCCLQGGLDTTALTIAQAKNIG